MPDKKTIARATKDKREGKSASTQAGEFVREEIDHIRQGKHGARSTRQAIAIGLSEARRAGVDLPPPKKGEASRETIKQAKRDRATAKKSGSKIAKKSSSKRAREREQQGAETGGPFRRIQTGAVETRAQVGAQAQRQ